MNWLSRVIFVRDGDEPLADRVRRRALRDMGEDFEVLNWQKQNCPPLPGQRGTAYLVRLEHIDPKRPIPRVRLKEERMERVRLVEKRVRLK